MPETLEAELDPLLNVQLNSNLIYLCSLDDNTIIWYHGPGLMMKSEGGQRNSYKRNKRNKYKYVWAHFFDTGKHSAPHYIQGLTTDGHCYF